MELVSCKPPLHRLVSCKPPLHRLVSCYSTFTWCIVCDVANERSTIDHSLLACWHSVNSIRQTHNMAVVIPALTDTTQPLLYSGQQTQCTVGLLQIYQYSPFCFKMFAKTYSYHINCQCTCSNSVKRIDCHIYKSVDCSGIAVVLSRVHKCIAVVVVGIL